MSEKKKLTKVEENIPRATTLRPYAPLLYIFVIGVFCSLILFNIASEWEKKRIGAVFERQSSNQAISLQNGIETYIELLQSIKRFYKASRRVDRDEFKEFVEEILVRYPEIQALEWAPKVLDSEREAFVEAARNDGFTSFQITERNNQGEMFKASQRSEYFPVFIMEPFEENEPVFGFDIASNPIRLDALNKARISGETMTTARIKLVQEKADHIGLLAIVPIYKNGAAITTKAERQRNLLGFVLGVFRVSNMFESILSKKEIHGIDFMVSDETASANERFLYLYASDTQMQSSFKAEEERVITADLKWTTEFQIGGRRWSVKFLPSHGYFDSHKSWRTLGALSGGLLITILLLGYFFSSISRTIRIEQLVKERTADLVKVNRDLVTAQKEIAEKAHKAGMADIATGVLHNVGNILNSVNTSTAIIQETLTQSKLDGFVKANALLRANQENIEGFIINNPKGKTLIRYYLKLEDLFKQEHSKLIESTNRLREKVNAINDVISAQQAYAGGNFFTDKLSLAEIVEDVINLQTGSIIKHEINLQKKFSEVPKVIAQKSKLIQILMNLYKNAKEAMEHMDPSEKQITIEIDRDQENNYIRISDTGCGIEKENLETVFNHGFTTKKTGHGFGLHSCANYMTEMGGRMWAESDGVDKGATFVLSFPLDKSPENDLESLSPDIVHVVEQDLTTENSLS